MLLTLLVAGAAATVAADHPPGWKGPDWDRRPSAEEIHAAYPVNALKRGVGGKVELTCAVNIHGLAENCRVVSEQPPNLGFGTSAMLLVPDFVFKPATVMGRPVPGDVQFPIIFGSPGGSAEAFSAGTFTLVARPTWVSAPSFADLGAAYPKSGGGVGGYSAFRCEVNRAGTLNRCDLLGEEPGGRGFGPAARGLIGKFRIELEPELAAQKRTMMVNLPIRLIDPASDEFKTRRVGEPNWLTIVDPATAQMLFPFAAAEKGPKEGLGVASCTVGADGALKDCTPGAATPDGLGFSEAAVRVASVLRMNLWTQEGGPVDGSRVELPIRFKLAAAMPKTDASMPPAPPKP
jgi:TonB family protein